MNVADKLATMSANNLTIAENEQKVYEAGQKSEYDRFWDEYQSNGNRITYPYGFSYSGWNDKTYNPKHKPKPTNASYMFSNTRITDKKIDVDFSEATNMNYCFVGAYYVKHIGEVDTRVAKSSITQLFAYCRQLHTIDKLILLDDGTQTFSNVFLECNALENIIVEGVIGNNLNIQYSPLTLESAQSIKNALGIVTTAKTLTLHAKAKAKLSESDIAEITQKGWTLA